MNQYHEAFNHALFNSISSVPSAAANPSYPPESNPDSKGSGTLIVQVTLAKGAIPIENAKVTVSSAENLSEIISEMFTDKSGRTVPLSLPAPGIELSQTPGNIRPYSTYNIKIEFPGYLTEEARNVPVFDKTTSFQPVSLEPIPEENPPYQSEIVIDESIQGPSL